MIASEQAMHDSPLAPPGQRRALGSGVRLALAALAAATLGAAVTVGPVARAQGAAEPADVTNAPTAPAWAADPLASIGLDLERARALPAPQRDEALAAVAHALDQAHDRGIPGERRAAEQMLAGALAEGMRDFPAAARHYRDAEKADGRGPFADDAAVAGIRALEASGRDADAAKAWLKWEQTYKGSPLLPEVRLARAWNALRRMALPEAGKLLQDLRAAAPWMADDPRVRLALGTHAYLDGRTDEALAALGPEPSGPAADYLRALCLAKGKDPLKSAALFQQVAEKYPDSPLRDHALLAKANNFLACGAFRSAAEEFQRVASVAQLPAIRAEAQVRHAAAVLLDGRAEEATGLLRSVVAENAGTDVAARAQFLLGEALVAQEKREEAIVEYNAVLTSYFEHSVAASAQYRVGRCLDALGRAVDAVGAYQAVVSGYPLEPEAPAAAYLAGVGLLQQNRPQAALPYFQLVLDRYTARADGDGTIVFASPAHQELTEAALCLLELSYQQVGDLGQLSGAPHLLLSKMPPTKSQWRAYTQLIDADALAAQGRLAEAQLGLQQLLKDFPEHPAGASALQLMAWTQAQQGNDELAIRTEQQMLEQYGARGEREQLAAAYLHMAHVRFNQKHYRDAAEAYEDFLQRFPDSPEQLLALYQAALCYVRLDRAGDAVDRLEALVKAAPNAPISEKAWLRAGDLYFQAGKYDDAKRCYTGLLANFAETAAAGMSMLRMAQCDYNAGRDADALAAFAQVSERFPGSPHAREAARGMEQALYRLGQQTGGVEQLAQLVEQYPSSAFAADAQFEIARRMYEQEHWADAAESFRRVVSQFPAYSAADRAQFLMADALAHTGDADRAKGSYEQFLVLFPQSALRSTVQFRLGMLYFEAKDAMRAAVQFTSVLDSDAEKDLRAAAHYNLALCKALLGQTDEAVAALQQYRTTWPADARAAEVAYQLGDLHERGGRMAEASAEFERVLSARVEPALMTEAAFRLGRCREQTGDADGALRAYEKAMSSKDKADAFRLSAVARCAALYESKKDFKRALAAYRDLSRHASDSEVVAAAKGRVSQLEAAMQ